jgi:hypothetical protein
MKSPLIVLLVVFCVGCARHEYDLVRPTELAGRAPTREDYTFERDPLEYRLRTVSSRLVMRIYNQTDDAITLLGTQSTVVDPRGQSHPFVTQTIAPQSYIKLILPPMRPRVYQSRPTIGIGVGGYYGRRAGRHGYDAFHDDWPVEPRYLTVVSDSAPIYWEWRGEGDVRLTLVFDRDGERFTHDFVIARVRA